MDAWVYIKYVCAVKVLSSWCSYSSNICNPLMNNELLVAETCVAVIVKRSRCERSRASREHKALAREWRASDSTGQTQADQYAASLSLSDIKASSAMDVVPVSPIKTSSAGVRVFCISSIDRGSSGC